ncbi:MAG: 3'(2'),5'-bisphosphate nucleotidase CysQ [Bacteroidota bacterium]
MFENLLIAANAAIGGGEAIMKVYESGFEVEYKSDSSPLTLADKNANDIIINNFLEQTGIPIISEENKEIDYNTRKEWSEVWIVDPLDGTKEFVKRNGEFTVNISLVINNKPILGVIFVPVTKTLYLANVNDRWSKKIVLKDFQTISQESIDQATKLEPSLVGIDKFRIVGSRSHMNHSTKDFIESQVAIGRDIEIVSRGSSLKFCLVAEGLADVYPRFAPTMEWDTAAGQAICEAVGIKVISLDSGAPMIYNKKDLLNPHFIVSSKS